MILSYLAISQRVTISVYMSIPKKKKNHITGVKHIHKIETKKKKPERIQLVTLK